MTQKLNTCDVDQGLFRWVVDAQGHCLGVIDNAGNFSSNVQAWTSVAAFTAAQAAVTAAGFTWPAGAIGAVYDSTGQTLQGFVDPAGNLFTTNKQYDLCIYGASFAGCCGAIDASKAGFNVILINDRNPNAVGGMVTNGIQMTDAWNYNGTGSANLKGAARDFYKRAAKHYGLNFQNYYFNDLMSMDSHVALTIIKQMLAEAGVTIVNNATLQSLTTSTNAAGNPIIKTATFTTAGTITAAGFSDCTYCGDLLAMAGVPFLVGRDAATTYGETYATYDAGSTVASGGAFTTIDPYNTPTVASSGLIPCISTGYLLSAGSADPNTQAPGYRMSFQTDASKVPFYVLWGGTSYTDGSAPSWWNTPGAVGGLAYFEMLRRYMLTTAGQALTTVSQVVNIGNGTTTPVPIVSDNSTVKYDVNSKGLVSMDYIYTPPGGTITEGTEYVTATPARRAQIEQHMKQHVIGFIYFMLFHPSVPAALATNWKTYGLSPDEYAWNGYFPEIPYIREGRRPITDNQYGASNYNQLTAANLVTAGSASSMPASVAMAYYAFDTHACQYIVRQSDNAICYEGVISNGQVPNAAKLPASVMFPPTGSIANLTFGVCVAVTHVAWSSIRVEGTLSSFGTYAALYAALAGQKGIPANKVNYQEIQKIKDWYGLWSGNGITLTTDGANTGTGTGTGNGYGNLGTVVTAGSWTSVTAWPTFGTNNVQQCSATTGTNTILFTPTISVTGDYDVYLLFQNSGAWPTPSARGVPTILITSNSVTTSFTVNETANGDDGLWYYAGRYRMIVGGTNTVLVTHPNTAAATNMVAAKFVPSIGVS